MFVVGNFQIPWKDFYNIMGDHFAQKDVPREMRRPSWQNTKPSALDRIFPKDEVDDFPQVQVSTHMFPYLVEIGDAIMCRNAYQDKLQDAPKRVYMSHLLLKARNRSAKDSRDKIYGLHYLFEASEYKLPTVDYKISVAKVYEDVTFAILQQSKSWWILSHLFSKRGVSTMELPSWVPDFTTHAIWHQHANLRFQNLNALEEALEKDEKSTKERASHTFRLERTPEGILTNAVFLWTVMAATSEMPSNPTLDYSFDRKFEQTSFELVTDAMEDFLFIFADWLKSMEQTCKSWTDETALNGVIEPEDQPQSEAMKAIACTFERSTWNAFRMVGNLSAEGSRVLPRVLNNVRRCISPDETHPCRICGTKEIHKGNLAVKHFMQWITSQGVAGLENIMYLLYSRAVDHSLVLTSTSKHCQGHFGFCRNLPRPGDEVVLLPGLADPVVVPLKNNSQGAPCYQVIGVTSGMKGPAIRNPAGDGVESSFCFGTCSAMEDSKTHESRSFYLI